MADYRVRVESGEAAANGDIHLDVYVEKETDTDVWEPIPLGHRTMVLNGAAVMAITGGAGTDAQKRAALLELFRAEAESWGIAESDEAYNALYDLLPAGWPVSVVL